MKAVQLEVQHNPQCCNSMRQCSLVSGVPGRQCRPARMLLYGQRNIHKGLLRHLSCKAGAAATLPRSGSSSKNSSPSFPNFQAFNDTQRLVANFGGSWGANTSSSPRLASQQDSSRRIDSSSSPAAVMPKAPPEWQPPTDPSGPSAPPEFTPPRDPGTSPRTIPEFEPPDQAPPGREAPTPGRPARPEEIPDPEQDPLRTPERRRETREPDGEPAEEPEPEEQDAMAAVVAYVEHCQELLSIEDERGGGVEVGIGKNSCPAALLYHPLGYTAVVNMHGANVVSWKRPDGSDILHLRPDSPMDGTSPILGGVPLIFPQYGRASGIAAYAGVGSSSIPTNGLLNRMHWSLIGTGITGQDAPDPAPTAVFATESDDATYSIWPFHFTAVYTVSLMCTDEELPDNLNLQPSIRGRREPTEEELAAAAAVQAAAAPKRGRGRPKWKPLGDKGNVEEEEEEEEVDEDGDAAEQVMPVQLRCVLEILNTGDQPFTFEAAVQSHVGIHHMTSAEALGLAGKMVLDCDSNADKPWLHMSIDESTTFGERRMDRVYIDAGSEQSGPVVIHPGGDRYHLELIHREGFRDLGLWNPHHDLPDPTLFQDFVAFSSGEIARPVRLQPEESWTGEMVLRLHEQQHLTPSIGAWEP